MAAEDAVPLMESQAEQSPQDAVTRQPQATARISMLSTIIKALLGETELHGCYCLFCQKQESQQVASALLIGTKNCQNQSADSRPSDDSHCYISSLKQHLNELHVQVFSCKSNYCGSLDDLYQLISEFFTKSDTSLFILYYSGLTNERGDWSITTTDDYGDTLDEYIRLDTVAKKWKAAKAGPDCYLLFIDADGSEKWREKVEKYESEANIIIMTSSGSGIESSVGQYT